VAAGPAAAKPGRRRPSATRRPWGPGRHPTAGARHPAAAV